MSFPSSIDAPDTSMQGTTLLSVVDHALDHRTLGSAVINIENKLGIGSGSAAANQILVGSGAGTAQWGSVWDNATLGTATLGTPLLTGGTVTGAIIGTNTIIGGTVTSLLGTAFSNSFNAVGLLAGTSTAVVSVKNAAVPTTGQVLTASSGTTAIWQTPTTGGAKQAGTTITTTGTITSNSFADVTGGSISIILTTTSHVFVQGVIQAYANNTTVVEYLAKIIQDNGTVQIGWIPQVSLITGNRRAMVVAFGVDNSVAAGTYTYKLQHRNSDGTTSTQFEGIQLSAIAYPAG